jgi:hypothetical protein
MLLKINPSDVDNTVRQFNEDSTWADPYFVEQVVAMVAGSRKNGPELIEFMMKISDTRGYSALLEQIHRIDELRTDNSLEGEIANAIIRGCEKAMMNTTKCRYFVVTEVRDFMESDRISCSSQIAGLQLLLEASWICWLPGATPCGERRPAGGRDISLSDADDQAALRKAVEEAAGI